jgi:hypothetical protein
MIIILKYIQYDLKNKNITILEKMTIYQIYNQLKKDFISDQLKAYPFPMYMYGDKGYYEMQFGWTMIDSRNII